MRSDPPVLAPTFRSRTQGDLLALILLHPDQLILLHPETRSGLSATSRGCAGLRSRRRRARSGGLLTGEC
jgi:hypothetical protein